jgi:hypothetical protein
VYKSWDYSTIFFVCVFVSLLATALALFIGGAPYCDAVAAYEC